MKFTKMQGTGNDYIYINCFDESYPENPSELSKKLSDRHYGIGSDGLILISPSKVANIRMDVYNSDGTRAQICGNALRCVGKYAYERDILRAQELTVETLAGINKLYLNIYNGKVVSVRVNMGQPVFTPSKVPIAVEGERFISEPLEIGGNVYTATAVSFGNPHCVIFTDDIEALDLQKIGPEFDASNIFPERINVEFAQFSEDGTVKARIWERGAGETLSCGTGASAVLVAGVLSEKCARKTNIQLHGGDLLVEWDEKTGDVYMTGGARFVFDGDI